MTKKVTTSAPKLFIGIDIHKRKWHIQAATDLAWGKSFSIDADVDILKKWADNQFPEYAVSCAYEAECCGFEHARFMHQFGWDCIVFNPADITRTGSCHFLKN